MFLEKLLMCGIFGFILKDSVSIGKVFSILKKLETSRYPDEDEPVGGYGAGIAVVLSDGNVVSEKVGKIGDSPVCDLEKAMGNRISDANVLVSHVRFPSSEFMSTVKYSQAAQPFVENFKPRLTIVCAHNGELENYQELRVKLGTHIFESEEIGLIDSEVVPHYFSELLNETGSAKEAIYDLLSDLKGDNSAALMQIDEENAFLHLIHKGKSKGLTIWANDKNEVIFCSRPEPLEEELKSELAIGKFEKKIMINRDEDVGLKISFSAIL
jgi:glucosamine 6-phosphate synthetase-like amidotransferase/phosphosugar isomerase protein